MGDTVKDKPVKVSLGEDYNPLYQDIARFRAIMFDSLLKPHDMTMSQGWVLVHLLRENGLRQSELAERLEVATVTTSKLIDRLEATSNGAPTPKIAAPTVCLPPTRPRPSSRS